MIGVGLALPPDATFLDLLLPAARARVDYFEVAPETLWLGRPGEALRPNGFHERFLRLRRETGLPFVAHGVGFSVGSSAPDAARRARWLERIRLDQELFEFAWYTDHLGWCESGGRQLALPLPLPMTAASAENVRASLRILRDIVPDVGVENSVFYMHLGDPLEEAAWLRDTLKERGMQMSKSSSKVGIRSTRPTRAATVAGARRPGAEKISGILRLSS